MMLNSMMIYVVVYIIIESCLKRVRAIFSETARLTAAKFGMQMRANSALDMGWVFVDGIITGN